LNNTNGRGGNARNRGLTALHSWLWGEKKMSEYSA